MAAQAELVHLKSDEPLEHVLEVLNTDGALDMKIPADMLASGEL